MQAQGKRRIALGVTTGGLLAGGGLGFAHADVTGASSSTGGTSHSPGVLSGNQIQAPIDIPINVCGLTANVLGLLNPASGNDCSNGGGAAAVSGVGGAQAADRSGASAQGGASDSPGLLSGNNVQVPVHVPVNVCGVTVGVVGAYDSANGDRCSNGGGAGSGSASGGSSATGGTHGSPGIGSGNNVQVPIDVPVNACGDSVSVIGLLDSANGDDCANGGPATPGTPWSPPATTPATTPVLPPPPVGGASSNSAGTTPAGGASGADSSKGGSTSPGTGVGDVTQPAASVGVLAHTGSDALMVAPLGVAMAGGGLVMYRKFKPASRH